MLYHRDNHNRRALSRKNITLIALVAISVFALLFAPLRNVLTQGVYTVAPSIWGVGNAIEGTWGSIVANFRDKNALVNQNKLLLAEIDRMQVQVLDRNLLTEKVAKLEESLGRAKSDDRVVAEVISERGQSSYDILVLDVGSDNGIAIGDMVVFAGSGVIGEIVEVVGSSAKAKLYSSPGEEAPAMVGKHSVPIIAAGRGMGNFEAKVPQDSSIAVGDSVISAKGNLIFGTVSLVEEEPALPFKRIFFREPFNITEIRSVEVVISKRL